MKKILNGILVFILACASAACTSDGYTPQGPAVKPHADTFTFGVIIPGEKVITARGAAVQPGMIESLHVLVFDPGGALLTRAEAMPASEAGKYTVLLQPTDPQAPADRKKRIVHFVCNYDWSGFSDAAHVGKHENEVLTDLSVGGGKTAYWQRLELPDGIGSGTFPNTVELLRNVAKISVINNSALGSAASFMTGAQFALGDYFDYGTVAPFSTSSLTFEEGAACESPEGRLTPISGSDFVPATEDGRPGESILCYERNNSTSKTPLYIILKGKYGDDHEETYYKIDIINEGAEKLYDITRNCHYIIDIQEIAASGSPTLQEAADSPASNNLLYSVLLEDYAAISDGRSALMVETTAKTLVQPDQEFSIAFSYVPDITTGMEKNDLVNVELRQDAGFEVFDASSGTISTDGVARYKVRTVSSLPEYGINTARLIFTARHNDRLLRRVVSVRFRQPSLFGNMHITPSTVPAEANKEVALHLTIPSDIRSTSFPLEVFFTTMSLTPDLGFNDVDRLTLDYSKPGVYRYKYIVRNAGDYTVHFKTTGPATNETLVIESELFSRGEVLLKN